MKQIAWCHIRGGNGSFAAGVAAMKKSCEAAARAIEMAVREWSDKVALLNVSHDPTGRAAQDWDEELKLGLALHLQASHGWIAGAKQKCKITAGEMEYTTGSGLTFGWSRWEMDPGYSFFVVHPSGQFPQESTLRASLEAGEWRIETYKN